MSISNLLFQPKPSKIVWLFQLVFLVALGIIFWHLLSLWLSLFLLFIAILLLIRFNQQIEVVDLAYLDNEHWTMQCHSSEKIHHLELMQVIDHQLYIVLYWQNGQYKSTVIWKDQLDLLHWKQLKVLAKLHRPTSV
ncbi:MAG: hypothetical protein QM666_05970 [Acinetobacter sp.]